MAQIEVTEVHGHGCSPKNPAEGLSDYLEVMSQTVFWVGISWRVVESKWSEIREAFQGFDPLAVANLSPDAIDKLASDRRVIRHRGKLDPIVYNAGRILELDDQYGSFHAYLNSHGDTGEAVADVRDNFKYLDQMSAYQFLHSVSMINEDGSLNKD